MADDPWSAFLRWLETLIVPDWGELVSLLPVFVMLGVVGPGLTLLVLYHLYHRMTRRTGRVRLGEVEPTAAPLDATGQPVFPPNAPFCTRHELVYDPTATVCEIDGVELSVLCPVDMTPRPASQQTCRVCGTRYVLGASHTPFTVRRTGHPPEGGAAVA